MERLADMFGCLVSFIIDRNTGIDFGKGLYRNVEFDIKEVNDVADINRIIINQFEMDEIL